MVINIMKNRKRRLYVIPGLGESTRMHNYREMILFARKSGIRVIPVSINWSDKMTMVDYVAQADSKIPDNIENDYVLGFSFGAYIAGVLSGKKKAKGYIFCSISPYFKENIKDIPAESKKYFGSRFMNSLRKYSFPKNGNGTGWFLIGKKDWKLAIEVARDSYKKWTGKKYLNIIPVAGHELNHANYIKGIKNIIKTL